MMEMKLKLYFLWKRVLKDEREERVAKTKSDEKSMEQNKKKSNVSK